MDQLLSGAAGAGADAGSVNFGTASPSTPAGAAGSVTSLSTRLFGCCACGRVANQANEMLVMKKSVASTAVSFEKKVAEPRAPNTVPDAPDRKSVV